MPKEKRSDACWVGGAPVTCDICKAPIVDEFFDGATRMGPWANMCPKCFLTHGRGLGTGRGQKYQKIDTFDKEGAVSGFKWMKVLG